MSWAGGGRWSRQQYVSVKEIVVEWEFLDLEDLDGEVCMSMGFSVPNHLARAFIVALRYTCGLVYTCKNWILCEGQR